MKTNKVVKMLIALMAVVILNTLTVSAYAETGSETLPETFAFKRGQKQNREQNFGYNDDRLEDWFENRIESRENRVDFGQLPEKPTEEDMLEFFKQYFTGESTGQTTDGKSGQTAPQDNGCGRRDQSTARPNMGTENLPMRPMRQNHEKADRFEDWFEDRIDARKHHVDFSELPENPTDEEIVEFFRKNFMGENTGNVPAKPQTNQGSAPDTQTEKDPVKVQPNEEPVKDPAKMQPTEESGKDLVKAQPEEETVKDPA